MFVQLIRSEQLIFYVLAAEALLLMLLQLRTNALLRRSLLRREGRKKEKVKKLKEEVKSGVSQIPVVKFEKQKEQEGGEKAKEVKGGYDPSEMAVLQEMMSEFFG